MKKITLLLIMLLMMPTAFAQESKSIISSECAAVDSFDYEQQVKCQIDTYAQAGNKIMSDSNDIIISQVYKITQQGMSIQQAQEAQPFYNIFRYLFIPFFLVIIMYSGYKYMTSAAYPEKRAESRQQLQNIIIIAVLISALTFIINTSYDVSNSINTYVMDKTLDEQYFSLNSFKEVNDTGLTQSIERFSNLQSTSPLLVTSSKYYLISMQARNLILLFLISISPIILLFYFFAPTIEYGKIFTYLFFIELIIPVMYMIILKFSMILAPGGALVQEEVQKIFALTSALFLNIILHLVIILTSIFKATINAKQKVLQDV